MAIPETPLTRLEQYLNRIATGDGVIPNVPLTRIEQYLNRIATKDGAIPETPLTRLEQYLAKIAGEDVAVPVVPLTRAEQYLAKSAGQDATVPETPLTRIEQYLAEIAENGGGGDDMMLTDILCLDGIQNTPDGHQSDTGANWWDLSGNEHHFYRSNGTNVTTWDDNSLLLTGKSAETLISAFALPNPSRFYAEAVFNASTYGSSYQSNYNAWVISNRRNQYSGSAPNYFQIIIGKSTSASIGTVSASSDKFTDYNPKNNTDYQTGNLCHIAVCVENGTATAYVNGAKNYDAAFSGNISNQYWALGFWNNSFYFSGHIYRIGIHSEPFTASDIAKRWAYFQSKFGG